MERIAEKFALPIEWVRKYYGKAKEIIRDGDHDIREMKSNFDWRTKLEMRTNLSMLLYHYKSI